MTSLSIEARKNAIARQLDANRARLWTLKWIGSPAFLLAVGYLVYFGLDRGVGLTTKVLGGVTGLVVALITAVRGYRGLQVETAALEEERLLLMAGNDES